jgi:TolA-binding protein
MDLEGATWSAATPNLLLPEHRQDWGLLPERRDDPVVVPDSRSSSAPSSQDPPTTMSVTLPSASECGSHGFEDLEHPLVRTLDQQSSELQQLRDAVLQLNGFAAKERHLLQQIVADELWRQRRQLLAILLLLLVLVLGSVVLAGVGGLVLASGGHGPDVYNRLGIASKADLEALLPREEMNERTLHDLDLQLNELIPKIAEFVEIQSSTSSLEHMPHGNSERSLRSRPSGRKSSKSYTSGRDVGEMDHEFET